MYYYIINELLQNLQYLGIDYLTSLSSDGLIVLNRNLKEEYELNRSILHKGVVVKDSWFGYIDNLYIPYLEMLENLQT